MSHNISIRKISACTVYRAEYDINGVEDFFNMDTGQNILYDLQYLMESENPDVIVPELGEDYNYFELPMKENPDGTRHIIYWDMTIGKGQDSPSGAYAFENAPEITAAVLVHKGSYDSIDTAFASVYDWIEKNGYTVDGPGRCSAIHGPWDRDDPEEFVNEIQVPVKEA